MVGGLNLYAYVSDCNRWVDVFGLSDCGVFKKPLGRGSTGRTEARNLNEQLVMKEAMSNPANGIKLDAIKLNDKRWPHEEGWKKMSWNNKEVKVDVHYVGQWEDNVLKEVDDFKFKDELIKK